ncbi:zinc finger protein 862-like [Saccoglossus kowalevskii]
MQQAYPRDNFTLLWKLINTNHKATVPNLITLAKAAVVLPVNTAICERRFSAQNKVKTSLRNRLEEASLNRLLTILVEGPPFAKFDASEALKLWQSRKSRRIFQV